MESLEKLFEEKVNALEKRLDDKIRNLEKLSDRGWNFGHSAVISIISIIGGALLTLLIQLAVKK